MLILSSQSQAVGRLYCKKNLRWLWHTFCNFQLSSRIQNKVTDEATIPPGKILVLLVEGRSPQAVILCPLLSSNPPSVGRPSTYLSDRTWQVWLPLARDIHGEQKTSSHCGHPEWYNKTWLQGCYLWLPIAFYTKAASPSFLQRNCCW